MATRKEIAQNQKILYDDAVANNMFQAAVPTFKEFQKRLEGQGYQKMVYDNYKKHNVKGKGFNNLNEFRGAFGGSFYADENKIGVSGRAAAISASANNAVRQAKRNIQAKLGQSKKFDGGRVTTRLKNPLQNQNVQKNEFNYNATTGKTGTYTTTDGVEFDNEYDAVQYQNKLDKYGEEWSNAVDMGIVPSELDKADPDLSETDVAMRQMERRQKWLNENQNRRSKELNESMHLQGSPFVASGGAVAPSSFNTAISNEANRLSDVEYGAYNTAKAYNQMLRTTLLQELKEQKQRNENAGWWKDKWNDVSNYFGAMFNTMLDPKLYSQGVMDAAISNNLLQVKKGMEDGTIKKGSNAGKAAQAMLGAIQQQQGEAAKQQQYGTKAYQYGDMSGRSLKFMADFGSSGWRNVMTTGFTKAGEKVGEKMALGALGKWFTKNTGRVLGDMAGSAALAATNQLGSTYNNVIERYVGINNENGGVTQDKNGDLKFNEGVSLGKAIKDGFGSATIENFSEMFGEYLPGAPKLLSKLGLSKVSAFFEKIGNNAYYKWLSNATNKSGIQGVMAEISEEEFGTALHAAWGDGDGSWRDFNVFTNPDAREKQIDTCLGMFYSVGFMQAPRTAVGAINAVQYFKIKHQVAKADKFGQMMFNDKWDEIKSKIDVTTNADLTKTVLDATRSDSMTAKQKDAVINYAMFLSKLRGFNQASDAKTKDKVEEGDTAPTLSNDLDDAYTEGHNADDSDKHNIQLEQNDKANELAAMLHITPEQLHDMADEDLEAMTGNDEKLDQAIYDYQVSTAKYQGVMDGAQDEVDMAVHQAAMETDNMTDLSRGTVRKATIKATGGMEDYEVYIISGNIATHDDGSIDVGNSDDMIIYYDPTTGRKEHADAMMFADLIEELTAADVKAQAINDAKENAIKKIAGIIDGTVEVGSQFNLTDTDGTEHTYEVLDDYGDGTAAISIDGNVVENPYSLADLQQMKDLEDQKRLESAKAEREQMEKERAAQQTQETEHTQTSFDFNQILNDNGNVVLADVLGKDGNTKYPNSQLFLIRDSGAKAKVVELKSDGTLVPHAVNKKDVRTATTMTLDEYKQAFAESSMIEDNSGENRGDIEVETPTIDGETAAPAEETAAPESAETPATEQTPAAPAITLEDGTIVPMLEDGNPDFSKLTAAQTAELYDTQFGEDAESVISSWVSDAKKALDKASNMTVKGKTFVEQKAAKDAKEKSIADAQAAYDSAIAIRDAYNERQLAKVEDTAEGRKALIEKARRKFARLKSAVKDDAEAVSQLYRETIGSLLHRLYDSTGIDVTDTTPLTAEEYVASNLGAHSLNYEGTETSKGVKQETGLSREDFAKTQLLAADGKGTTIDALVHSLWENRPSNLESLDTQDIRNALIGVLNSGFKASEARNFVENIRIAQAENILEEQKRAQENAAYAEQHKAEQESELKAKSDEKAESEAKSEEKLDNESDNKSNDLSNETYNEKTNDKINDNINVPEDATDENPLGAQRDESDLPFSAKENGKQQTTAERADDVEKNKVDDMKVVDNIVGQKTRKAFDRLAKMMGANIQWQYSDKLGNGWIQETTDADGNVHRTIFITLDSSITEGAQFIFGHEMTHQIKNLNPAAYNELTQLVIDTYGSDAFDKAVDVTMKRYSDAGFSGRARDYYAEEVVADAVGEMIRDLNLAHTLAMKMSHPLLAAIHEILQKIKLAFFGTEYSDVTKNIIRSIEQAYVKTANGQVTNSETGEDVSFSLRQKPEPKKKGVGYKVFVLKDGKLYPPMVANPDGAATPVGVWLDADAAPIAGESKTGRPQVKQGGKGTQGGSGKLAYRPGWHLGVVPYAIQFNRKDADGNKTLFPKNFVFAEVEYAADVDYQEEARQEGINPSGKYQHSLAGLKHLPTDGYYMYRTNPNPETDHWVITGAMKVNRILTRAEQAELVKKAGREPQQIQDGDIVTDDVVNSINQEIADAPKFSIKTYHGSQASFDHFDHSFMGSGEGAQAYGWGTYVSEVEGIAKAYAKQNSAKHGMPREYKIAQLHLNHAKYEYDKVQRAYDNSKAYIDSLKEDLQNYRESISRRKEKVEYFAQNNMPETVDKLLKQIKRTEDTIKVTENDINMRTNDLEGWKRKLEEVKKKYEEEQKKFDAIPKPQIERNLYSVDIPDDNGENYIGWDEKMTPRMRDIRKEILEDNGYKLVDSDETRDYFEDRYGKEYELFKEQYKTGGTFYEELAQLLHSQKLASLALKEYGFVGVKVIAQRNTGGNKEGKMNYVIFDENNAKITEHTKFSLKSKPVRFEAGKKLSDEEKKEVLSTLKDAYKVNGVPYHIEETAGGKEKRVYEPTADSYVVSDITNRPLRYYITLPDGRVAHPTEVYPNISDNEVKSSATKHGLLDDEADQIVSAAIGNMKDIADNAKAVEVLTELQNLPHETHDVGYGMNNAQSYNYKTGIFTSDASQAIDYVVRRMRRKEDVPDEIPAALKKAVADSYGMVDNLIDGMSSTKFSLKDEKTLAGVHNITEEKLRKALKLGGFANPSLAVIDTSKSAHDNFGEISFIAPSALLDKRTGKTGGTWITDAYTQRYPSVERQMSEKGSQKFEDWVDSLEYPSAAKAEIKRQTKDVLEDNGVPAWELMYLKEKGIDIKAYDSNVDYRWKEIISDHPTAEDILGSMQNDPELKEKVTSLAKHSIIYPTWEKVSLEVRRKMYEETGVKASPINPQVRKQTKEIFERDYAPSLLNKNGTPKKSDVKKVVEQIVKEHNDTKKYDFYLSKVKASNYVNKNGLYDDYIRWQENKLDEFGTKNRIFRGYKKDGSRKYVPETLENVSKAMREEAYGQTNGSEYTSFGSFIAKLASRVDSTDEMRANKDKLSSNKDKEEFYEKWSEVYYDLAKFLYNDVFYGEQRLHDIVLQSDPKKYAKKEYGITLTPTFMKKLDALKNAVQTELKSAYFETKYNRPLRLNEFAAAVVPDNLGEDVRKGIENAGLPMYNYDPNKEGDRSRAFNEAINSSDNIRFSLKAEKEKIVADAKANGTYMTAPNGEKTKLNAEQWATVRTTNFKNWFGDWENDPENASKVVDENGEPMVVWHGRSSEFNTFEKKEGVRFIMGLEDKVKAEGFFFSPDKVLAEEFASNSSRHRGGKANVVPCFLNIRRPMDLTGEDYDRIYEDVTGWEYMVGMDTQDNLWGIMDEEGMADKIKEKGYDGAIFVEEVDDSYEPTKISYCALDANQIKSAENNNGDFSADNNDIRFSLAGERGASAADKAEERTARMDNLSVARKMEEEKKDAKTIKIATGWERGADGKWRYEMPDAKIKDTMDVGGGHIVKRYEDDMLWNGGKLSDVIDAPELFKAYPQLKDVHIETDAIMNDMPSHGEYNAKTNTITIHADELKYMNSLLNHEIQHAIQDIEGFAKGGSPRLVRGEVKKKFSEVTKQIKQLRAEGKEDEAKALIEKNRGLYNAYTKNDDYNSYKSLAGEVEARNVQERMNMTPEERRKTLAESTEDVARKDQIFLGVGDVTFSLRDMADGKESGSADMAEDLKSLNTPDEVDDAIKTSIDDMPSGWKMANKKMIHIAQALGDNRKAEIAGEEPKFSLKDGTLIKAGTYFSGGGLVEEGLKGIIDPVVAVEYDEKISGVYRNNFGQHIVTADVRDVDPRELVKQIDGEVEYFHASPVCKNYSQAKSNHAEVELDKETAASTAEFINAIKPKVVTIENVKGYKDSEAMKIITDALDANGYTWDADVYNAADYGGYTNRERLIVRAVRDGKLPEKPKKMERKSGWYEAVADIIQTLTEKKNGVAPWMDIRLKADGIDWRNIDKPLYVMGSAYADGKVPHAFADELLPTLRTKSGDVIVMPDGKVYRAMGRVLARVSGVSDDYKMPFSENLSHTIIGNGIPTQLTEHVIAPLLTASDPKFSLKKTNNVKYSRIIPTDVDKSVSSQIEKKYDSAIKEVMNKVAERDKRLVSNYIEQDLSDFSKMRREDINQELKSNENWRRKNLREENREGSTYGITDARHRITEATAERELEYRDVRAKYLSETYGLQGGRQTSLDMVDRAFEDTLGNETNRGELRELYGKARKILVQVGAEFGGVSNAKQEGDFGFAGTDRDISLFIDTMTRTSTPQSELAHTILHEMIHQATVGSINLVKKGMADGMLTPKQIEAVNTIINTYDAYKADRRLVWEEDNYRDYGGKDEYEFAAEMADAKQRRILSIPYGERILNAANELKMVGDISLWQAIKNALRRLFEVSDKSKMDKALTDIMDDFNKNIDDISINNIEQTDFGLNGNTRFSLRYDQFEHDLNQWKKDNNLPKDAQRPTIPQRNAGESAVDFLRRVDEYRKQMALWKTAPTYEQHLLSDDTALGEFNRELQKGSVLKRIAFQDSMLAIRKAQEAIMKEVGVDRLNMAEDAYTAENRSHGKGKNEFEEYNNEFLQPLRKAYHQMKNVLGDSYDNVRIYMMAKHGLERDAQMAFKMSLDADYDDVAQRSAAYKAYKGDMNRIINDSDLEFGRVDFTTWRQRDNALRAKYSPSYMDFRYDENGAVNDYSGLSQLFGGSDFEEAAYKLVKDIEDKYVNETHNLWDATNAATKKILRDGYKAGMMSKDTYQYVRDMYSHYIPLRGWDGTTADQVWDYVGGGKGAFNQTLKTAHGRTSIADDPIAYIENMAESGILLNNKNWVKQHLMLLAQNHPTSLLTLSKAWYVKSVDANGNEEWIPATPQITSQMNSNQVKAAIDAFEKKMEQMAQTGDATQKRDGLNIAYPQTHSEEREHEVRVMKDGEEYVIYVNGDPQLAQAMNNTRAYRVSEGIKNSISKRVIAVVGRKMAAAYTSLSPLFIPSNYFRDLTMTLASTAIREDAKYNYLLRKNLATSWNLGFMLRDYQSGKLRDKVSNGNATPKEQMFYDFMMNGGETGFVSSLDVEDLKKKFKNDLKDLDRWKANPVKVGHTIMDSIEFLNRAIEDSNRFAVYMTSIQYGRSIDEAVNDAKNVTLNFNRKGTGEHSWQTIRNLYLFINPAVQSLQTLGALAKHHPFKFTAVTASWLASGVLVPIVNAALMQMAAAFGGGDGDDDKDWYKDISKKYWQFSKWERRNNFIMWVPFTHEFIKIPLAQEFRAFYGVGDMIASKMMGGELAEESWEDYGWDLLGQVVDMLPLDPTGYDGNILVSICPNVIRPIAELAFNVDFTGKPLFKYTEYNKYDPNFTKAYVGTPDWLIRASRMVNSIGNDYPDVQQNSIDAFGDPRYNLNNPAVVDHVLSSYLGGAYTMGSQVLGLLTKSLNDPKEIKVADIPLFSKFVSNPDDRPVTKKQGDEFWNMKENHDRAANTMSKLKKQAKLDGDYSMLERFYGSDEYKQYKQDDVKVKKYEEDKKKERAEESGEEYRPHKLNADDIYKAHATPKDDFEDLKLKQLYTKLNGFKTSYDLLVDTAPSQSDGYYNTNKAAIDAIDEISLDKQEISELKKGFLDDGKDAYNAEDMKQIRELRKKILAVLEKANKVVVANQKAKTEK